MGSIFDVHELSSREKNLSRAESRTYLGKISAKLGYDPGPLSEKRKRYLCAMNNSNMSLLDLQQTYKIWSNTLTDNIF